MLEGEGVVHLGVDRDHIQAHVAVRDLVVHQELPGQATQPAQLGRGDGGLREPGDEGAAGLNLDEDQSGRLERHDVQRSGESRGGKECKIRWYASNLIKQRLSKLRGSMKKRGRKMMKRRLIKL